MFCVFGTPPASNAYNVYGGTVTDSRSVLFDDGSVCRANGTLEHAENRVS